MGHTLALQIRVLGVRTGLPVVLRIGDIRIHVNCLHASRFIFIQTLLTQLQEVCLAILLLLCFDLLLTLDTERGDHVSWVVGRGHHEIINSAELLIHLLNVLLVDLRIRRRQISRPLFNERISCFQSTAWVTL